MSKNSSTPPSEGAALFKGEAVTPPKDLFIPPDALEIWLESYEGPLELLWHLIRKNNYEILDIPIAEITEQYMEYIYYLEEQRFELASEYLVMASWLAEIKSALLLPKAPQLEPDEEEVDPRLELIEKLQLYQRYKAAAESLYQMPRFDQARINPELPHYEYDALLPTASVSDLINALQKVLRRQRLKVRHTVKREKLSVEERMEGIIHHLKKEEECYFSDLFYPHEGRYGISVSFLAILELTRLKELLLTQNTPYGDIHITLTKK